VADAASASVNRRERLTEVVVLSSGRQILGKRPVRVLCRSREMQVETCLPELERNRAVPAPRRD